MSSRKGYIDVSGGKNEDGVRIQLYAPNGSVSQKFRLVHQGDGRYKIFTYWGRILSTVGQSVEAGAEINTWTDHNSTTAEWYLLYKKNNDIVKKYMPVTPSEEKND